MKVLVIGAGGQVGRALARAPWPNGVILRCLTRVDLDLRNYAAITDLISEVEPDIVVNAAAYTDVDRAESEPGVCATVNSDAVERLAVACAGRNAALIHISTDFVFDGTRSLPYREEDWINPRNVYAQTKADGERKLRGALGHHIIVRTSWVFSSHGRNFLTTMLRLAREGREIRIVADRFGCPTPAADLAEVIISVVTRIRERSKIAWGTYHYCGAGTVSWFEFAQAIFTIAEPLIGRSIQVVPITGAEFAAPAARPTSTVLDCARIAERFGIRQRPWIDALPTIVPEALASQKSSI